MSDTFIALTKMWFPPLNVTFKKYQSNQTELMDIVTKGFHICLKGTV